MNATRPLFHLCIGLALIGAQPAFADEAPNGSATTESADQSGEFAVWDGVYTRSGRTVKIGEYMGAGGAVLTVVGAVVGLGGFFQSAGGVAGSFSGDDGASDDVAEGANRAVLGLVAASAGITAYGTGPVLMAGGTVRQAKAIRMVNPDAPRPWYGYTTWFFAVAGLSSGSGNIGGLILASTAGYVTGAMQKGKNRMHWDRATAQRLQNTKQSTFTVDVTPFEYEGNRGLALVGTF